MILLLNRGFHTFDGLYVGDAEDYNNKNAECKTKNSRKRKRKNLSATRAGPKFNSITYAAKAVHVLRIISKRNNPFFFYLALLTKVYPKTRERSQDIVAARLKKIKELDLAVKKVPNFKA